jgi:DNA-binding transcriptional regulator LsrR (DeoR family)
VSAMSAALTRLPSIPVVQLTGALSRPDGDDSSIEIVREVARISGGPAYFFYAPFIVADATTARALRRQPEVARAFEQLGSVTRAVIGIGLWAPEQSTVYDAVGPKERRHLRRLGVCAEFSGVFVNVDGEPVAAELTERMIGVTSQQLRQIPEVLGIAYGTAKAPAVRAALRGGYINALVTHATMARVLLSEA